MVTLFSIGAKVKSRLFDLPKISDPRGNLTFLETNRHAPFDLKRVYYLYDVPAGESRGGHAHRKVEEFIIAASGSFDVILNDGTSEERFHLSRPWVGLHVTRMVWRELDSFSSGSVCLVAASELFDEDDYIRDFDEFTRLIGEPSG